MSRANYAVYGGSFDPATYGHINLIRRASALFDGLTVAVGRNIAKNAMFDQDERCELLRDAVQDLDNVIVEPFSGLLVDFCRHKGAHLLLRGLRAVGDFEFEFQMGLANMDLAPEIETVFLIADPDTLFVSSSVVKEIAKAGRDIRSYVPNHIASAVEKKLGF